MKGGLYTYQSRLVNTTPLPQDKPLVFVPGVFTDNKKRGHGGEKNRKKTIPAGS
jgi:hypothetical protein